MRRKLTDIMRRLAGGGFARIALLAMLPMGARAFGDAATRPSSLHLTVVDEKSGKPLGNSEVELDSSRPDQHFKADAHGQVTLNLPQSESNYFIVYASHDGYVNKRVRWDVNSQLPSDMPPGEYTLALSPGTRISGRVLDDAGKPIGGAHVVIAVMPDPSPNPHEKVSVSYVDTASAVDGSWSFDCIPSHFKSIEIGAWDYGHVCDSFFPMENYSAVDELRAGTATLTLRRGIELSGTVLGPDGKPLVKAKVGIGADRVASNVVPEQDTDEHGHFHFAVAPGSLAVITVKAKGCAPEMSDVQMGAAAREVTIKLTKGNRMSGRVLNGEGQPLADAYIWVDTWRGNRTITQTLRTDKQGKFSWDEAPSDTVYSDVEANGYMRSNRVPMRAGANEVVVRLDRPLHVTGTVTDAQTHQPIRAFRVIEGISFGSDQPTSWQRREDMMLAPTLHRDGKFDVTLDYPYPGFAFRVEADGYLAAESRIVIAAEHEVSLEFSLQHGSDVVGKVMTADGKPAGGVQVVLAQPGQTIYIQDGTRLVDQGCQKTETDAKGNFRFPPQSGAFKLAAFGDGGFVQADQDVFSQTTQLTLKPWCRIDGKLLVGTLAGANQKIAVDVEEPLPPSDPAQAIRVFFQIGTTTDENGTFSLSRIPAGAIGVGREIDVPTGGSGWIGYRTQVQKVEAEPGKTLSVILGGKGRPVTGRVAIPAELAQRTDWSDGDCEIRSKLNVPPIPWPQKLQSAPADQRQKWYSDFAASPAGKTFFAAQQKAVDSSRSYPIQLNPDGTFRVDDVEAGEYTVGVALTRRTSASRCGFGDDIADGSSEFSVPEMKGGRSDEPLNLPPITVNLLHTIAVGDVAPAFTVATLDGKSVASRSFAGKYVLVDFWASWCGPCAAEAPNLKDAYAAFGKNPRLVMVSLSLDNSIEDARKYVEQNHLPWMQGFETGGWQGRAVMAFGVRGIPSIWLIDPDGKVVARDLRGNAIKQSLASALGSAMQ